MSLDYAKSVHWFRLAAAQGDAYGEDGLGYAYQNGNFAQALQEGQPVMVNVSVPGGEHEVVLDKTFQYDGQTWYEMIDSNQGPMQRRYLSGEELNGILLEKGVAYHPNKGTVPRIFR